MIIITDITATATITVILTMPTITTTGTAPILPRFALTETADATTQPIPVPICAVKARLITRKDMAPQAAVKTGRKLATRAAQSRM